jgi:hypothetical protein
MRRLTATALSLGLACTSFAGVAADVDPTTLVDCTQEEGVTLVVEGELLEETHTGAAFTYPYGEFAAGGVDEPSGGAFADQYQLQLPYAYNHIDGQRPTVTVKIAWDQPSDLDLDVLDSDGDNVAQDHAFNIDAQDYTATGVFTPEPCETYTVIINNSYAIPGQAISMTTEVTSKAPRKR